MQDVVGKKSKILPQAYRGNITLLDRRAQEVRLGEFVQEQNPFVCQADLACEKWGRSPGLKIIAKNR